MNRIKRLWILLLAALTVFGCVHAADVDDASWLIAQRYAAQEQLSGMDEQPVLSHEIVHDSERYVSIVFTLTAIGGNGQYETIDAATIARDGLYAGQQIGLTQLLGLEQEDMAAPSIAAQLVYSLVWQIVETDRQDVDSDYLDGLTKEDLETVFDPEKDFYLDMDGNVVFFIQSGEIAGEVAGVLRFPFAPAELLSAVHE